MKKDIKKLLKAINAKSTPTEINDCSFVGVQFDAQAVEAICLIAEGLIENAKALGKLSEVLKASNVEIEAMLKIQE